MRLLCRFIWKVWRKLTVRNVFWWRRLRFYAQGVRYGQGLIIESAVTFHGQGKLILGHDVWLGRGVFLNVWPGATLVIEDDTYIGRGTIILAHQSVRIGQHGLIAPYCHITDCNHGMKRDAPMKAQPLDSQPVRIGPDVWFGAGCSVLPGISIGEGCVIGARAVVTKDLPDFAIAVGVPAKMVASRTRERYGIVAEADADVTN